MSEYTPTTDEVRSAAATLNMCPYSEFDRWLAEVERAAAERAEAERDAALSTVAKVREAVSWHPECDRYEDGDAITCGWKSAYASVVRALGSVPSTGEGNEP